MIPKIIHYCWFGNSLMPYSQKQCIKGWKRLMPDYQFVLWNEKTFDLKKFPLADYAIQAKKYALASDVCRYNVLAQYGGIYLDTDVQIFKRLDEFLQYNFFSAIELYSEFFTEKISEKYLNNDGSPKHQNQDVPRLEILTSTMGAIKNLKLICEIRDYYNSAPASRDLAVNYREWVNNDRLVARYLTQYGFKYKNQTQHLKDNMIIFGTGIFGHAWCPDKRHTTSYHHNAATWEKEKWTHQQKIHYLLDQLGLLKLYFFYKQIKKKIKKKLLYPSQGHILCLHRVINNKSQYPSNAQLEVSPHTLIQTILTYKKNHFKFVSYDDIIHSPKGIKRFFRSKRCNITFDDGYADIYYNAFPILKKYNIPFTIFVTTDMITANMTIWWYKMEQLNLPIQDFENITSEIFSSDEDCQRTFNLKFNLQPDIELTKQLSLTWKQIREMLNSGLCTIGSHTISHPALDRIATDQCLAELQNSKKILEQTLNTQIKHMAYPYSITNEQIKITAKKAGYISAALGYGGAFHYGDDIFAINRIPLTDIP